MIKKSNTVRMLIIMLQAVCLFLVFNLGSSAYADTSSYNDFGITGINSPDSPSFGR